MKQVKLLAASVSILAALMVVAVDASATALTSNGGVYTNAIEAKMAENTFHASFYTFNCGSSGLKAEIEVHDSSSTASGPITELSFKECSQHVTILKPGQLIFHTDPNDSDGSSGNGSVTWSGGEITVQITSLGISCILGSTVGPVDLGTLTGSKTTGGTAWLELKAKIYWVGHTIFCGSYWILTGSYFFTTPDDLNVH